MPSRSGVAGFRLAALVAASFLLTGQAMAKDAKPSKTAGVLSLQSRPMQPGDHYSFTSTTDERVTGVEPRTQTNRQTFDIEVIAAGPDGLRLRSTLTSIDIEDASQPGIVALARAFVGVPITFDATPGVTPDRLVDWPVARAAFFRSLEKLAPGDEAARATAEAHFDELEKSPDDLAGEVLGDIRIMAGMQIPTLPLSRVRFPPEMVILDGGSMTKTAEISPGAINADRCEAEFSRSTLSETEGVKPAVTQDLETTATISSYDGWVLQLTETNIIRNPDGVSHMVVTIRRNGAHPGCGG